MRTRRVVASEEPVTQQVIQTSAQPATFDARVLFQQERYGLSPEESERCLSAALLETAIDHPTNERVPPLSGTPTLLPDTHRARQNIANARAVLMQAMQRNCEVNHRWAAAPKERLNAVPDPDEALQMRQGIAIQQQQQQQAALAEQQHQMAEQNRLLTERNSNATSTSFTVSRAALATAMIATPSSQNLRRRSTGSQGSQGLYDAQLPRRYTSRSVDTLKGGSGGAAHTAIVESIPDYMKPHVAPSLKQHATMQPSSFMQPMTSTSTGSGSEYSGLGALQKGELDQTLSADQLAEMMTGQAQLEVPPPIALTRLPHMRSSQQRLGSAGVPLGVQPLLAGVLGMAPGMPLSANAAVAALSGHVASLSGGGSGYGHAPGVGHLAAYGLGHAPQQKLQNPADEYAMLEAYRQNQLLALQVQQMQAQIEAAGGVVQKMQQANKTSSGSLGWSLGSAGGSGSGGSAGMVYGRSR